MKHPLLLIIIFFCFFCPKNTVAQIGWQWGKTVTQRCSGIDCLSEFLTNNVTDKNGNAISSGYIGDGDSILFGSFWLRGEPGYNPQLFITKMDSSGNYLWVKGSHFANAEPMQITTDSAGNIYLLGYYYNFSGICSISLDTFILTNSDSFSYRYFMAKLSPEGNVLWAKNLGKISSTNNAGGIGVDNNGNVYVTGVFDGKSIILDTTILLNSDTSGIYTDFYIAKYDLFGNFKWAEKYGGKSGDYTEAMSVLPSGEFYLIGVSVFDSFSIGSTTFDTVEAPNFLAKFNSGGIPIWVNKFLPHLYPYQIITDVKGSVFMVGFFDSSILLGSFPLTLFGDSSSSNVFVTKFDSTGHISWANSGGSGGSDMVWNISFDSCSKNTWICGSMQNPSMNFDGHILTAPPGYVDPVFMAEFDDSGKYITGLTLPSGGDDWLGIVVDNMGSFFVSGDYYSISMIFGADTLSDPTTLEAFFVAKYKYDTLHCPTTLQTETSMKSSNITLYPNPSPGNIIIDFNTPNPQPFKLELFDLTGRLLRTYSNVGNGSEISLPDFAAGLYQCKIICADGSCYYRKLVLR